MPGDSTFRGVRFNESSLEPVFKNLMTTEEYSKIEHPVPYIFTVKSGDREIRYFGSPHVSDPQSPIFTEIEQALEEAKPDIVFVEGPDVSDKAKGATREEAIQRGGESGLTARLAVEKGITLHFPESTDEALHNYLLAKGFSKEQIFVWDIFRTLPQYGQYKYVEEFIKRFKETTHWKDFNYSYEHAMKLGEQILGRPVDIINELDPGDFIDPIPRAGKRNTQTILNRISESSLFFRDRKIISDIAEALKTHKRIFLVYGASHAVMQEPALRKLLEG